MVKKNTPINVSVQKKFGELSEEERIEAGNYALELKRMGALEVEICKGIQSKFNLASKPHHRSIRVLIRQFTKDIETEADFADLNYQRARSEDDVNSQKKKILNIINKGWYTIKRPDPKDSKKMIEKVQEVKPHVLAVFHGILSGLNEHLSRIRGSTNSQFQMNFLNYTQNNIHGRPTEEQRTKLSEKTLNFLDRMYDAVEITEGEEAG